MEGKGLKSFVIIVLVLGLVLEQTHQVEAEHPWCCETTQGKKFFNDCVKKGFEIGFCASGSGCILQVDHDNCFGRWSVPAGKNHFTLFHCPFPYFEFDTELC